MIEEDAGRTPILATAGRTITRVERDSEIPLLLCFYDEHDKLLFKARELWSEDGPFDTSAIDHINDSSGMPDEW